MIHANEQCNEYKPSDNLTLCSIAIVSNVGQDILCTDKTAKCNFQCNVSSDISALAYYNSLQKKTDII